MLIREAAEMIDCPFFNEAGQPAIWADLGCGTGTFTQALASLLPPKSTVYAVDKADTLRLQQPARTGIHYIFQQADFVIDELGLPLLDGILMANALHYVKDKDSLLQKILAYCKPEAVILIVEYDTDQPVPQWVPYPIKFSLLSKLFSDHGFSYCTRLKEKPSLYRRDNLYSALIQKTRS